MSLFDAPYESDFYRAFPWAVFLVSRGHHVTIMCTSATQLFHKKTFEDQGVRIIEMPAWLTGGRVMSRLTAMYGWGPLDIASRTKEIKSGQYDIVHTFEHHMHVALPVYLAGRRHIPVLVSDGCDHYGKGGIRELAEQSPYRYLYSIIGFPFRAILDFFERDLRRRADAVLVISSYLQQRVVSMGIPEKNIHLIPGSSETERILPQPCQLARRKLGVDETRQVVLFFGAGQFDLDFSLEAFSLLLKQMPETTFIVVGKTHEAVTRKSIELGVEDQVIQTGWIEEENLGDWLACADICLIPMKDTPINHARWPNKIGYYMAAGRPTVSTAVSDVGTLIEKRKIGLVAEANPADFADKLQTLLRDPQLAVEMGQRARQIAENEFAMAIQGTELEQLYKTLTKASDG